MGAFALLWFGAEKFQRLGEKEIGIAGVLVAHSLRIEGPGESRLAIRPAVDLLSHRPVGDKRSLALAAHRDKGDNARTFSVAANRGRPGVVDDPGFRLAADELCRRVGIDAGDVEEGNRALTSSFGLSLRYLFVFLNVSERLVDSFLNHEFLFSVRSFRQLRLQKYKFPFQDRDCFFVAHATPPCSRIFACVSSMSTSSRNFCSGSAAFACSW